MEQLGEGRNLTTDPVGELAALPVLAMVQGLCKRFGSRDALCDVSFAVREGEILGLLGPNGAGKTTTLSILATLLRPDAGSITLGGVDLSGDSGTARAWLGYVPQELALYPTLSARGNLLFLGRIYGLKGRALDDRVRDVLEMVGLRARARDRVRELSGGMQRRLNLAAGLLHRPRLLLLDEPTVGVDPHSRNFILEHLRRLRDEGMTMIYSTHYMEEAERICDRVAIIDEGRILAQGTVRSLVEILRGGVVLAGISGAEVLRPSELAALPHVISAEIQDGRWKLQATSAEQAVLGVIALCRERHLRLDSLELLEPNLENVFLHLTGKRLRD